MKNNKIHFVSLVLCLMLFLSTDYKRMSILDIIPLIAAMIAFVAIIADLIKNRK